MAEELYYPRVDDGKDLKFYIFQTWRYFNDRDKQSKSEWNRDRKREYWGYVNYSET